MKNLFRVRKDNKFGYIDNKGKLFIDFCFDFASDFKDGIARIKYNSEWGYIDSTGNIIFTITCDLCTDFSEGLAVIKKDTRSGYVDMTSKLIIDCRYYQANEFHGGIALVLEDIHSSGMFINKRGEAILPPRNYLLSEYSEGLINVVEKSKWGYIDIDNNFVIKPKYKSAQPFREGKAAVSVCKENYGFINKEGEEIIPCIFTGAMPHFSEGLCSIMKDKKSNYGYINDKGNEAIPFDFSCACDFSEGFATIKFKKNRKYGFIDMNGRNIVYSKFQHISNFEGGLAEVILGNSYDEFLYGYVNYKGEYVWEPSR